jgi:hypothetical protein
LEEDNPQQQSAVTTLINPANPNLSGPNAFPYFPRGGPQPKLQPHRHAHHIMGYVTQWGGMDVGSGACVQCLVCIASLDFVNLSY